MMHNMDKKTCWLCGGTINQQTAEKLGTPITKLGLSTRALNCLRWAGIEYVEQLLLLDYHKLYNIKSMGQTTMNELHEKVKAFGFDWELTN